MKGGHWKKLNSEKERYLYTDFLILYVRTVPVAFYSEAKAFSLYGPFAGIYEYIIIMGRSLKA
jgi:hypothetical protein